MQPTVTLACGGQVRERGEVTREEQSPTPSLSTRKEDISAFSNLENTPFSLTFGAKKIPFSLRMQSF